MADPLVTVRVLEDWVAVTSSPCTTRFEKSLVTRTGLIVDSRARAYTTY